MGLGLLSLDRKPNTVLQVYMHFHSLNASIWTALRETNMFLYVKTVTSLESRKPKVQPRTQAMLGMNLAGALGAMGVESANAYAGRDKAPFRMCIGLPPLGAGSKRLRWLKRKKKKSSG